MSDSSNANRIAYEQLMIQYRSSIEQECLAYQSLQSAELSYSDLVQEVTLRVWERITQFKGLESPSHNSQSHNSQSHNSQSHNSKSCELRNLQFEAWLRKTSRSILNNLYRDRNAQKRNPEGVIESLEVNSEAAESNSTASSIVEREEECSRVHRALHERLDEASRTIVTLHIHQNQTFPEIAKKLGLTYDQVRHVYRTALRQLESEIG